MSRLSEVVDEKIFRFVRRAIFLLGFVSVNESNKRMFERTPNFLTR